MKTCTKAAAIICFSLVATTQSQASNCAVDEYDHNGSVMEVQMCDNDLFISYTIPKASLRRIGVRSGTTLFDGTVSDIGTVSGLAYRFSAKCGAITYDVEGAIRPNSILLEGNAPTRNPSCTVTEFRYEELLFTLNGYADKVASKDWYAIAGTFRDRAGAEQRTSALPRQWQVMNTRDCPNFSRGYWLAAAGPMSERDAREAAGSAQRYQAYAKSCH